MQGEDLHDQNLQDEHSRDTQPGDGNCSGAHRFQRRAVLGIGLALIPGGAATVQAQEASASPPQPDDHFVYLTGPHKGEVVKAADLVVDGPQIQAFPADPSGIVRNGSRFNLVIMARLDGEGMSDETKARAADGVVAYSAVCTHQACPVNMWSKDKQAFVCSCHASTYDPRNGAEVISGPAPRSLAALPLKSKDGVLLVAGPFAGKVGASPV